MFFPDPGSAFFPSRIRIKELSILTQKIVLSSRIYDPSCSSWIRIRNTVFTYFLYVVLCPTFWKNWHGMKITRNDVKQRNFFIVQRWAGRQPAGRQDSCWGTQGAALPAVRFSGQTTFCYFIFTLWRDAWPCRFSNTKRQTIYGTN